MYVVRAMFMATQTPVRYMPKGFVVEAEFLGVIN